ncbi:MAG: hypothetical protein R3F55_22655 [Alphaproteobacteria bacterium]
MSFSLQERERRRRRRTWSRMFQVVAFFAMPAATFILGYGIGQELDERRVANLREERDALQIDVGRLQRERAGMIQQVTAAQAAAQEWEIRYERDVPLGERASLMELVDRQLALGVTAERLGRFVEAAAAQRECGEPSAKRFLLGTDANARQAQSVSFAGGQVTVSGQGTAARNDAGLPQGWFDIGQSVTLEFAVIGGERVESAGILPLHTSVLLGAKEVRFTVSASDVRGYVEATAVLCE